MQMTIGTVKFWNTDKSTCTDIAQIRANINASFTTQFGLGHNADPDITCLTSWLQVEHVATESFRQQVVIENKLADLLQIGFRNPHVPTTLVVQLY